jgi:hypothetical protein
MARTFAEQSAPYLDHLRFEERLALLVLYEVSQRAGIPPSAGQAQAQHRQRGRQRPPRGRVDKSRYQRLLAGLWLPENQYLQLTGPTKVTVLKPAAFYRQETMEDLTHGSAMTRESANATEGIIEGSTAAHSLSELNDD